MMMASLEDMLSFYLQSVRVGGWAASRPPLAEAEPVGTVCRRLRPSCPRCSPPRQENPWSHEEERKGGVRWTWVTLDAGGGGSEETRWGGWHEEEGRRIEGTQGHYLYLSEISRSHDTDLWKSNSIFPNFRTAKVQKLCLKVANVKPVFNLFLLILEKESQLQHWLWSRQLVDLLWSCMYASKLKFSWGYLERLSDLEQEQDSEQDVGGKSEISCCALYQGTHQRNSRHWGVELFISAKLRPPRCQLYWQNNNNQC